MKADLIVRSLLGAGSYLLMNALLASPGALRPARVTVVGLVALLILLLLLPFEDKGVFPRFLTRGVVVGLTALSVTGVLVWSFATSPNVPSMAGGAILAYGVLYGMDRVPILPWLSGAAASPPKRVLVVGAGEAGEMLVREVRTHTSLNREVVGFVDDDPDKQSSIGVSGIPVLGGTDEVASLCRRLDVDEVIIAMPSVDGAVIRTVTRQANHMNAALRIVPGIREIIEGDLRWNQIRRVRPEDLLGRETVRIDTDRVRSFLRGKSVLVTGAAGSIGRHLVEEMMDYPVRRVAGFDINESDLYELEASGRAASRRQTFESRLGDVRDPGVVDAVFRDLEPDVVFHAAALKHVPMLEDNPVEALKTNLVGSLNVFESARKHGTEHCVLISTDKAVEPQNIMGLTKHLGENLVATFQSRAPDTRYVAVRFGNVIGSRGSVVPLFKRQIESGGPVTVTNPDAVRYFMTPGEAAKLLLMSASLEERGVVYVLDLGDPISILDLARQLITLAGYEPDTEIPITITGLRKGEKMEEKLTGLHEQTSSTVHPKIQSVEPVPLSEDSLADLRDFLDDPPDEIAAIRSQLRAFAP